MIRKAPKDRVADEENLRFTAETYYTMSTDPVTVREMVRMDRFSGVTIAKMERWAEQGHWWDKRQSHLDGLRERLRVKMADGIARRRMDQIRAMEDLIQQGYAMLADKRLKPKNGWESVASTVLKINEAVDKWSVGVAQEVLPRISGSEPGDRLPSQVLPALNDDEARAAARTVVQMRRARANLSPAKALPDAN